MSGLADVERVCFICGHGIALVEFLQSPETGESRFAICGACGAPNEQQDTAFVVIDRREPRELPAPTMDVFPLVDGGWRACCDCGLTEAVATQAAGWAWVLDHLCMSLEQAR